MAESTAERVLRYFRYSDLNGYNPVYTFGKFRTAKGGLVSLAMLLFMLNFIVTKLIFFADQVPIQNTATLPMNYSVTQSPLVAVALVRRGKSLAIDDRYLSVVMEATHIRRQDSLPRIVSVQSTKLCNIVSAGIPIASGATCMRTRAALQGTFPLPDYQYIKVAVYMCRNSSRSAGQAPCRPRQEILDLFFSHNVELFLPLTTTRARGGSGKYVYQQRFQPLPGTRQNVEVFMRKEETVTHGWVGVSALDAGKQVSVALQHDASQLYYRALSGTMFAAYVRLGNTMTQVDSRFLTMVDLLGQIGAQWSILALTLGGLARLYNRRTFDAKVEASGKALHEMRPTDFDVHGRLSVAATPEEAAAVAAQAQAELDAEEKAGAGARARAGSSGGDSARGLQRVGSARGEWRCAMCAMTNSPLLPTCSLCEAPRGDTQLSRSRSFRQAAAAQPAAAPSADAAAAAVIPVEP